MYYEFFLSEISVYESYKGGFKVGNFFCKWFLVCSIVLYYDIRLF